MLPRSRLLAGAAALAALCTVVLLAPGTGAAGDKDKKTITITDKDKDGTIKAAKGDTLLVKLPATAGTGFTWAVNSYDKDKLETDGKLKTEVDKEKKVVGGPVTQVFTFTAKAAGKAELEMKYSRPFEKDKAPAKLFKVTVQID